MSTTMHIIASYMSPTVSRPVMPLVPLFDAAIDLAERCRYDEMHAHHVARLATSIFDQLADMHHLGDEERSLMQLGALLHDIGYIAGKRKHHKRALDIILDADALPLDHRQRLIVGSVARYHRKSLPAPKHNHFAALGESDRQRTALLAGFVRLADGLDSGHAQLVRNLSLELFPASLRIVLEVRNTTIARKLLDPVHKIDLLEQTLDRRIDLHWQTLPDEGVQD
ncbi:MAG: HD domain-containing protein [Phycisphaeraceae bacterium]